MISKDKLRYNGKLYSIDFDPEKKPCEKCCLREECLNDENESFLVLCEEWIDEGACYVKEEIKED